MVTHTAILHGLPTPHVHLWAGGRWCLQQTKASSVIGPVLWKLHVQSTYVLHVFLSCAFTSFTNLGCA